MKINQDTYAVGDVRLVLLLECDFVCVCLGNRERDRKQGRGGQVEVIGLSLRCLIFYVWEKARAHMTEDAIRPPKQTKKMKNATPKKVQNLLSHPNPPDQNYL